MQSSVLHAIRSAAKLDRAMRIIHALPLLGEALLSKMSREAHPMRAAGRRKIVAPGESPGFSVNETISTVGATDSCDSFAPTGLDSKRHLPTGLRPWLRSVAALRLNKDAAIAATSVTKLIATSSLTWTVLPQR